MFRSPQSTTLQRSASARLCRKESEFSCCSCPWRSPVGASSSATGSCGPASTDAELRQLRACCARGGSRGCAAMLATSASASPSPSATRCSGRSPDDSAPLMVLSEASPVLKSANNFPQWATEPAESEAISSRPGVDAAAGFGHADSGTPRILRRDAIPPHPNSVVRYVRTESSWGEMPTSTHYACTRNAAQPETWIRDGAESKLLQKVAIGMAASIDS